MMIWLVLVVVSFPICDGVVTSFLFLLPLSYFTTIPRNENEAIGSKQLLH